MSVCVSRCFQFEIVFSKSLFLLFNFSLSLFKEIFVLSLYIRKVFEYNYQHWFSFLFHILNAFSILLLLIRSSFLHGLFFLRLTNSRSLCIIPNNKSWKFKNALRRGHYLCQYRTIVQSQF